MAISTTNSVPALPSYNVSPTPTTNNYNPYGTVPGQTTTPPSTYQQTTSVLPSLPNLTAAAGSVVGGELAGTVPTDVMNQIQNAGASWGVSSGMPGSGLAQNSELTNLGLTSIGQQQAGLSNYNSLTNNLASQQLSPSLLTGLSQSNAVLASAPDPQAAQQQMMQNYLQSLSPQSGSGNGGLQSYFSPAGDPNAKLPRMPI